MNPSEMKRPSLPIELYQPSVPWSAAFVLTAIVTFLGFGLLASYVAGMSAPLWIRILFVPPLLLGAQQGAHLLGWVGHEGIHLNLHQNKYVSIIVGCFVSAMSLFVAVGYGISHWNHHRFTNQASDPDVAIYPKLNSFWSRFVLARVLAQRGYTDAIVKMALGRPLAFAYRFPFPPRIQQMLARLNLAFLLLWLGAYTALAIYAPFTALFAIGLPLLLVIPFSGLRIYVEHGGTEIGIFRDSRSYVSPLYTVLFFGNNHHLEHHLYPAVPCYNLAAVHRILKSRGYYERWGSPIDATVAGPLFHTMAVSRYPGPLGSDLPDDPFRRPEIRLVTGVADESDSFASSATAEGARPAGSLGRAGSPGSRCPGAEVRCVGSKSFEPKSDGRASIETYRDNNHAARMLEAKQLELRD